MRCPLRRYPLCNAARARHIRRRVVAGCSRRVIDDDAASRRRVVRRARNHATPPFVPPGAELASIKWRAPFIAIDLELHPHPRDLVLSPEPISSPSRLRNLVGVPCGMNPHAVLPALCVTALKCRGGIIRPQAHAHAHIERAESTEHHIHADRSHNGPPRGLARATRSRTSAGSCPFRLQIASPEEPSCKPRPHADSQPGAARAAPLPPAFVLQSPPVPASRSPC
jgi:hypothetical protein